MRILPRGVLAALLVLVVDPAWAQDVHVLTFEAVAARAQSEAMSARGAALAVGERRAAVAAARAAALPMASVSTIGAQRYGLSFDETAGRITQAGTQAFSAGLDVSYTLFDGSARAARLARSRADLASSELLAVHIQRAAVSEALRWAYALARDEASVVHADVQVEAVQAQAALVAAQVQAGRRPATERFQAAERLAEAEGMALEARRVHRRSMLELVRHLALEPTKFYRFVPPPVPERPFPDGAEEDALVHEAIARRADVRALEAEAQAAAADRRVVQAGSLPSVSLFAGIGTSYTSTGAGSIGRQIGENRGSSLGLRVGMPLLTRWSTRAAVAGSEARTALARLAAEARRREIDFEIRVALADGRVLQQAVLASERRVDASAAALEGESARYLAGVATLADLADQRARHAEAIAARDRSHLDIAFQYALLDFLTATSAR